jgi:hypothetical protein
MANHAPGFITGSTVSRLMSTDKKELPAGALTFCMEIARERCKMCEIQPAFDGNESTEWGNFYEDEAITRYIEFMESKTGVLHFVSDKQTPKVNGWLSCSVDGITNGEIVIDAKCPKNQNYHHLRMSEDGCRKWLKENEDQLQFNMMMWALSDAHLISYDPRWVQSHQVIVAATKISQQWLEKFNSRYELAEKQIQLNIERILEAKFIHSF